MKKRKGFSIWRESAAGRRERLPLREGAFETRSYKKACDTATKLNTLANLQGGTRNLYTVRLASYGMSSTGTGQDDQT